MADDTTRDMPQRIATSIYVVRGQRVMLDEDLAGLYGVPTRALNQAVRRNMARFPEDFVFRLTEIEVRHLKSQTVTSSWGGRRKLPLAFTEQGVAMLSSVLRSETAAQVNVQIMRAFVRLREMAITQTRLAQELEKLRGRVDVHDASINAVMEVIGNLLGKPDRSRKRIGFKLEESKPGQKA